MEEATSQPIRHALVVLGGLSGLELSIAADDDLGLAAEDASILFDHWVNVCPNQGSRTIRTEVRCFLYAIASELTPAQEALTITLSRLKPLFDKRGVMA